MNLCNCGCGTLVKRNYKKGHGRKGRTNSLSHNQAISLANKGRKLSFEQIELLRRINTGKKYSIEERKEMSRRAKSIGAGLWMKGRKIPESTRLSISKSNIGRVCSASTKKKISEANKGERNGMYGYVPSLEQRKELSSRFKKLWVSWRNSEKYHVWMNSKEHKIQLRVASMNAFLSMQREGFMNTKPELMMKAIFADLGVWYVHQFPIDFIEHPFVCDFYLPSINVVVEVDGLYWHKYPVGREIDRIRDEELKQKGVRVIRFWENHFDLEKVSKELICEIELKRVEGSR